MPECRRRIDLDDFEAVPIPPRQPEDEPCLHFVAAWGGARGPMVEAVLFALAGNREFLVRNLRPAEVRPARLDEVRPRLETVAQHHAHVVLADPEDEASPGVLFADRHEANHVAREFAHHILGDDAVLGGGRI
jgi:hypothetical protein